MSSCITADYDVMQIHLYGKSKRQSKVSKAGQHCLELRMEEERTKKENFEG